jgi:hypothetical protein
MATTFQKRQKEMKRLEKRQEKAAKKLARKEQSQHLNNNEETMQIEPLESVQNPE